MKTLRKQITVLAFNPYPELPKEQWPAGFSPPYEILFPLLRDMWHRKEIVFDAGGWGTWMYVQVLSGENSEANTETLKSLMTLSNIEWEEREREGVQDTLQRFHNLPAHLRAPCDAC